MTDYDAKFNDLLSKVKESKNASVNPLADLQHSYASMMGVEDPNITQKIQAVSQQYDNRIEGLVLRHQKFKDMMAKPDRQFQLDLRNETGKHQENPIYKGESAAFCKGMLERSLNSDRYLEPIFPEQKIQLYLPALTEIQMDTVRDLIAAGANTDLVTRIKGAVATIRKKIGGTYDIMDLTEQELFQLQEGLTKYLESSSNTKIDSMMPFITEIYRAPWIWNTLGEREQNAIKYSMKKDGDTAFAEECQTMTSPREQKLAQIILNHCKVLKNCAQLTTVMDKAFDPPYDFEKPDGADAAAILYVGRYLVDNVQTKREPLYTKVVKEDLLKLLKVNRAVEESVTPTELDSLRVYKLRKIATSLVLFHNEHKRLTYNQRSLAFDIISQFYLKLQSAPNAIKAKIQDRVEAIANPQPELLTSQ